MTEPTPPTLTPATIVALSRFFDAKARVVEVARERCAPGEHPIKGAVQIVGTLNVGDDYLATPTARLSALHVASLLVTELVLEHDFPKTRALALLRKVFEEALRAPASEEALGESKDEITLEVVRTKGQLQKRLAELLPKEQRRGVVKFSGIAEAHEASPGFARARL